MSLPDLNQVGTKPSKCFKTNNIVWYIESTCCSCSGCYSDTLIKSIQRSLRKKYEHTRLPLVLTSADITSLWKNEMETLHGPYPSPVEGGSVSVCDDGITSLAASVLECEEALEQLLPKESLSASTMKRGRDLLEEEGMLPSTLCTTTQIGEQEKGGLCFDLNQSNQKRIKSQ